MMTIENLINTVSGGLKMIHILNTNCDELNVKDVSLLNEDTLCCSFYPVSQRSNDIKLEIATIMGFFNGFFRDTSYENINLNYYAVRAFDINNMEILNALSTKSAAENIGTEKSIEWLKLTLFQENTEDYRLSQAKQIIFEIENGLREIVKDKLRDKYGENWWDIGLNSKLGKDVKEIYFNQFGMDCTDGDILIAYTFTLQLKKIILTHFNLFKSYFKSPTQFENSMDQLNKLRREEAHNRPISDFDLVNLRELHEDLLSKVLIDLKSFQSVYLTENWRIKIKKIMNERRYRSIYSELEIINELDLGKKLLKVTENLTSLISYLDDTIRKLKSITVPVHKKDIHKELLFCFEKQKELQQFLLDQTLIFDNEKINSIVNEINLHKIEMDKFSMKILLNES
ncbi:Swt1 family HEPN domain-containing protein [Chryseobacterium wangxinyae]|uniref:Swt1 family HEPN domain-containing protein n=1 Tax=Chryseobacterium sp. CY350 TaxID=2997336 RepID=UPI00226E28F4|nr:Swt1 family HEPN domain-containing protein [Chryseobacterium sp. CY350]MCY0977174.1 Swt1 family HEPN domain-containing protein [Chryseobacterium sp. CY350]WBZ95805.1 Swt1 family HEPN domain-containing protein [Chryseobacterium sp. CY350]